MEDEEKEGQSRDSAVSSVISYLERQTRGGPPPPRASVANGQDAHIRVHRSKWCSLQNISGKAETTSTSMTRVCHKRRPSGRPSRPGPWIHIAFDKYLQVVPQLFHPISAQDRKGINSMLGEMLGVSVSALDY